MNNQIDYTPEVCISCEHICKTFPLKVGIGECVTSLFGKGQGLNTRYKQALTDVSFQIGKGEIVGLIGVNGSGKSTLAKIVAGISAPTSGKVSVRGEVNMLSASSGLNQYMTGTENIRYKSMLLGLSRREIKEQLPLITEFADLGGYIDQPLRTYSTGMRARLGFAISVFILPEVLIVDEALSAGDVGYAQRCTEKIKELKQSGRTILFVSHAVSQVQDLCDRVLWIHNGHLIVDDVPAHVIAPYCRFARDYAMMNNEERKRLPDVDVYMADKQIQPHPNAGNQDSTTQIHTTRGQA